jgi:CDP-4-dehydro-6-deoxyglucose reductase
VQDAAIAADHDWSRSLVYACGNPAMVQAARDRLLAAGLPADRYRSEAFHPAAGGTAGAAPQREAHPWERLSPRYTLAGILDARQRSMQAVAEIAALMRPGMTTREAIAVADEYLRRMGASNNWHPTYVRFGPDTQSPPIQRTDYDRKLQEHDIFVLDIGPVWDGHEGDYGDTFVLGADADRLRCAEAAREVFRRARLAWLEGLTGAALYDRASEYARELGCELVREIPGHRVSDFPHALYGKHLLAQADFVPADGIWVLEIQVRDAERPMGAFYEDVLLR